MDIQAFFSKTLLSILSITYKNILMGNMVVHALIPAFERQRQMDLFEIQTSLSYIMRASGVCGGGGGTQLNLCHRNKNHAAHILKNLAYSAGLHIAHSFQTMATEPHILEPIS